MPALLTKIDCCRNINALATLVVTTVLLFLIHFLICMIIGCWGGRRPDRVIECLVITILVIIFVFLSDYVIVRLYPSLLSNYCVLHEKLDSVDIISAFAGVLEKYSE